MMTTPGLMGFIAAMHEEESAPRKPGEVRQPELGGEGLTSFIAEMREGLCEEGPLAPEKLEEGAVRETDPKKMLSQEDGIKMFNIEGKTYTEAEIRQHFERYGYSEALIQAWMKEHTKASVQEAKFAQDVHLDRGALGGKGSLKGKSAAGIAADAAANSPSTGKAIQRLAFLKGVHAGKPGFQGKVSRALDILHKRNEKGEGVDFLKLLGLGEKKGAKDEPMWGPGSYMDKVDRMDIKMPKKITTPVRKLKSLQNIEKGPDGEYHWKKKTEDTDLRGDPIEHQFIRSATKKEKVGGSERNKAFSSIPDKAGHTKVYMPYGEKGAGFYYTRTLPKTEDTASAAVGPFSGPGSAANTQAWNRVGSGSMAARRRKKKKAELDEITKREITAVLHTHLKAGLSGDVLIDTVKQALNLRDLQVLPNPNPNGWPQIKNFAVKEGLTYLGEDDQGYLYHATDARNLHHIAKYGLKTSRGDLYAATTPGNTTLDKGGAVVRFKNPGGFKGSKGDPWVYAKHDYAGSIEVRHQKKWIPLTPDSAKVVSPEEWPIKFQHNFDTDLGIKTPGRMSGKKMPVSGYEWGRASGAPYSPKKESVLALILAGALPMAAFEAAPVWDVIQPLIPGLEASLGLPFQPPVTVEGGRVSLSFMGRKANESWLTAPTVRLRASLTDAGQLRMESLRIDGATGTVVNESSETYAIPDTRRSPAEEAVAGLLSGTIDAHDVTGL